MIVEHSFLGTCNVRARERNSDFSVIYSPELSMVLHLFQRKSR